MAVLLPCTQESWSASSQQLPDCKGETPSWAGEKLETFFCLCVCIVLQTEEVSQIVVNSSVRARWTRDQ